MKLPSLRIAFPALMLVLILLFTAFGSFLTPYDYSTSSLLDRNMPPVFLGGEWEHPLGTDGLGRDYLERLVVGSRVSLGLALVGTVIGAILGTGLGLLAARGNRFIDGLVMAAIDFQAAVPFMIMALSVLAVFGSTLSLFVVLLGLYGWETYARLARNNALSAHTLQFVEAARVTGVRPGVIDRRHILPTISNVIIVQATLNFPQTILLESGLSFLGLGIQPPMTSLGQLLGSGRDSLARAWWIAVMPGTLILLTTLSISLLGDVLRDKLDPTTRKD
ncbi:ABC transporter permease [Pseudoroseicyclus sp. H15]